VAEALGRGKVFLNDQETALADASRRLSAGDVLRVWMDRPGSARPRRGAFVDGALHVVYEDDDLIVVNKPAGILTVPLERRAQDVSIYDLIERHWRSQGKRRPLVVHRIDRDTSGLVIFAVHLRAQQALKTQFRRREPDRVYRAVVRGVPSPPSGEWRDRLVWSHAALVQRPARPNDPRGIEAVCRYEVVESFGEASLVEVRLHTGKRNQIRIQAQMHGHPLLGERRYVGDDAQTPRGARARGTIGRQALHALRLEFDHPADGRALQFEAPLPSDFRDLLAALRAGSGLWALGSGLPSPVARSPVARSRRESGDGRR
jgi:23S rRNA pseudouridine1911/1915/1917 synthase